MNITLREVYQTNPDGDRFWKLKECYIRGSTVRSCVSTRRHSLTLGQIKYLRVPDQLLDSVKEEQSRAREAQRSNRGGHAGRGPARGGLSCCSINVSFLSGLLRSWKCQRRSYPWSEGTWSRWLNAGACCHELFFTLWMLQTTSGYF